VTLVGLFHLAGISAFARLRPSWRNFIVTESVPESPLIEFSHGL